MIKRTGIALFAVIVVAVFSGCTDMSAEQIAQKMKEKQDSIKDFSATMVITYSSGGKTETTKVKIMNKMPDKSRIEYLEPAEMAGQIMVNDGKTMWMYDPNKKEVTKMEMPEINMTSEQDYTRFIKELLDQTDISYQGMDKFEGRNVYYIQAAPKNGSMLTGMYYCMLVDTETWMTLKIEIFDKNDKLIMSMEYHDVKFNTGVPDSEFEFKVPEGVKVVTKGFPAPPKTMTLEEVRKEVNFTVMSPSYLPDGYVFDSATVFKYEEKETVSLTYKKGSEMLMVSEKLRDDTNPQPYMGEVEKVSINGADGKLIPMFGYNKMLVWSIGDLELTVLPGTLSKEEMIKVAESIK